MFSYWYLIGGSLALTLLANSMNNVKQKMADHYYFTYFSILIGAIALRMIIVYLKAVTSTRKLPAFDHVLLLTLTLFSVAFTACCVVAACK